MHPRDGASETFRPLQNALGEECPLGKRHNDVIIDFVYVALWSVCGEGYLPEPLISYYK